MSRLLAAEIISVFQHFFQHIAVADGGYLRVHVLALGKFEEADVAHYRYHAGIVFQLSAVFHIAREYREQLIAVDDLAVFVYRKASVSVAIECYAYIRAALLDCLLQVS